MAREGAERTRVGQHTDGLGQKAVFHQLVNLAAHAADGVVEPPCCAKLDLRREVDCHGGENGVVGRVQVVQDRVRQAVFACQITEERAKLERIGREADAVAARVRTDLRKQARILIADGAKMQLHGNAMRMIRFAEDVQQLRLFCARNVGKSAEPVVGDLAAVFAEIVQCLFQRFRHAARAVFLAQCTFRVQVSAEIVVRPKRRQNVERDRGVSCDFFVPFQRVRRIVRRAEHANVHLFKERNRVVGFQLFFCFLPDSRRSLRRQRCVYLKIPLQFQMRPMVQRAADKLRHDLRPFLEFLVLRRITGNILLVHAAGTARHL